MHFFSSNLKQHCVPQRGKDVRCSGLFVFSTREPKFKSHQQLFRVQILMTFLTWLILFQIIVWTFNYEKADSSTASSNLILSHVFFVFLKNAKFYSAIICSQDFCHPDDYIKCTAGDKWRFHQKVFWLHLSRGNCMNRSALFSQFLTLDVMSAKHRQLCQGLHTARGCSMSQILDWHY